MSVVLLEFRMLFNYVCDQSVDIWTNIENLIVEVMECLARTLELNHLIHLIQTSMDSVFDNHLGNDTLSLIWFNFKESAKLTEGDVLIDLRNDFNIMFYQSFL